MSEKSTGLPPKVSVIVAAFNVGPYIYDCIASLENQTYRFLEIVAVDDGSTDDTGAILTDLEGVTGSRLSVLTQENAGLSEARNNGLRSSTGELVCFVDGDDQVAPDMIAALVAGLESTGANLSSCGYSTYRPDETPAWSEPPYRVHVERQPNALEEALYYRGAGTNAWAKLASRELWMKHPFVPGLLYEDLATIPGVIADCVSVAILDASLYGFAVRAGSITRTRGIGLDRARDLLTAIDLCGAAEPMDADDALRLAFLVRRATELCRVINLCEQATGDPIQVQQVREHAENGLRKIAGKAVASSRAPIASRLRVSMAAFMPRAYSLLWRLKKSWEGWL